MGRSELCVLIPAFREAATIGPVIAEAVKHGTVIVGDDCSPDETAEIARANGAVVLRNESNAGYDATLNRLFDEALARGFHAAVTMDADGEHDPRLVARFRTLLIDEDIPLVLGIRPRKQRMAESIAALLTKHLFGIDDIFCGMKGYHLRLAAENGGFDKSDSVGTELALNSIRRGTPFRQLAVHGRQRRDAPRFGRRIKANLRLLGAIFRGLTTRPPLPRPPDPDRR